MIVAQKKKHLIKLGFNFFFYKGLHYFYIFQLDLPLILFDELLWLVIFHLIEMNCYKKNGNKLGKYEHLVDSLHLAKLLFNFDMIK